MQTTARPGHRTVPEINTGAKGLAAPKTEPSKHAVLQSKTFPSFPTSPCALLGISFNQGRKSKCRPKPQNTLKGWLETARVIRLELYSDSQFGIRMHNCFD